MGSHWLGQGLSVSNIQEWPPAELSLCQQGGRMCMSKERRTGEGESVNEGELQRAAGKSIVI